MAQVAIEGMIFSYSEMGSGKSTPILILHGWGRSANEWVRMGSDLSSWSHRKVYLLNLPGFGGSSIASAHDIFEYTELVVSFCRYLNLAKVILVGHSLGGRVGIVIGARHKVMIEKLILIDPSGVKPRSIRRAGIMVIAKMFGWVPKKWKTKMAEFVMDEDYHNSPALREMYKAIVKDDLSSELVKIKCKTTIVWGEFDGILPLYLTKVYRTLISDSVVRIIWGADHDPHLTKYEQTLAILEEYIE